MSPRPHENPAARDELWEAADWYENPATGQRLLDAAKATRKLIKKWPEASPVVDGWEGEPVLRWKVVAGFPYRVVYYVKDGRVFIVAYAHTSREPGYWLSRI